MESNGWDFNFGDAGSDAMTSIDTDGSRHIDCGMHSDQVALSGTFSSVNSGVESNGVTSVQGGLQSLDMQDLVSQQHSSATLNLSSNHLLDVAKWFRQKRLQRALAISSTHGLSTAHSYADNGMQEAAKLTLRRIWEGAAGTVNESPSVGSNGSKTSSPQQVSSDSLSSPLIGSSPYFNCFPCGKEQTEHHSLLFQARPEFHDGMLDSFNGASVHMNHMRDAMWHSHPQMPRGVLVPSFPNHNGINQSQIPCEGSAGKTKPRVRARRGQATDPHSIAERLRRERIAERIKLLQELVPNTNKTDRAIMLDEIIEYVKFLLIQVKLLSMSRLGSAALILPIVAGVPEAKGTQASAEIQGEEKGAVPCAHFLDGY
ncbi:hypothetical protein GOP47_0016520 [Adiantum capillus-veneris]|uniref:BHLH domain-containing protein n=1 Tax=Adiantum capillus-veneris TaxID=13818 RepID=A0A9D4UHZ3_ADICA|nr:hypothetical protein GOP47_0016520 [Adiantum capillus-veneris]